jgi:hypothetical protein
LDKIKAKLEKFEDIGYLVKEYTNLLGDPASAIAGSFYQLWWDTHLVRKMFAARPNNHATEALEDAIRFALIAGQTQIEGYDEEGSALGMTEKDARELSNLVKRAIRAEATATRMALSNQLRSNDRPTISERAKTESAITPVMGTLLPIDSGECLACVPPAPITEDSLPSLDEVYHHSQFRTRLKQTIRTLLNAKIDFTNGIVVPAVLTYGGCAAGFWNAYESLGDRDKAYSLAFGVFYAWLLVLAVISNCYAVTVNGNLLESSLVSLLHGNHSHHHHRGNQHGHAHKHDHFPHRKFRPRVVPFRQRVPTTNMWSQWIKLVISDNLQTFHGEPTREPPRLHKINIGFHFKFLLIQTLGWLCIAFFATCATLISYNTPTIGLDCRSFIFIMYAALSLLVSWFLVLRRAIGPNGKLAFALRYLYAFFVFLNALFVVGGTVFHLVGLFRNCRCHRLFASRDALVVLSSNTQLDMDKAKQYWLSVGYVAFTLAWLLSAVGILIREWIYLKLSGRFFNLHE